MKRQKECAITEKGKKQKQSQDDIKVAMTS